MYGIAIKYRLSDRHFLYCHWFRRLHTNTKSNSIMDFSSMCFELESRNRECSDNLIYPDVTSGLTLVAPSDIDLVASPDP